AEGGANHRGPDGGGADRGGAHEGGPGLSSGALGGGDDPGGVSERSSGSSQEVRLRRPSDLRGEGGRRARRGSRADGSALSWPERFAESERDRSALIVLLHLASLTPRRLLELAQERRTAAHCLEAVLGGETASESDRALAGSVRPDEARRALEPSGARFVAVGDPDYPPELLDLVDPPVGLFVRGYQWYGLST